MYSTKKFLLLLFAGVLVFNITATAQAGKLPPFRICNRMVEYLKQKNCRWENQSSLFIFLLNVSTASS
jgi:hypothetical protein